MSKLQSTKYSWNKLWGLCQGFDVCLWERKREVGATTVIYFKAICWEEYPWGCGDNLVGKAPAIQVRGPEFRYQAPSKADPWSLLTSQFSQLVSFGFSERLCLNKQGREQRHLMSTSGMHTDCSYVLYIHA